MDRKGIYRWAKRIFMAGVTVCCAAACNVYDASDLCCDRNVMHYRLEYDGRNYFRERIHSMRYLLFDADGLYEGQLYAKNGQLDRLSLDSLPYGSYTLLVMANLHDYGRIIGEAGEGLQALKFHADDRFQQTAALDNGDPIYWGVQEFTLAPGSENTFVTQLSNIHSKLRVRVDWEGVPDAPEDFHMQLEGVNDGYSLCPESATSIGHQDFPVYSGEERHTVVRVPLRQMALDAELVALRYADADLPVLHLWQNGREVIKPVSLEKVFRSWGWFADRAQVQDYGIRILIKMDGSVVISPYVSVGISDWVDGGVFG